MNIEATLIKGTEILKKNKIPNPQLDCEILLSNLINEDKKYIILNSKKILNLEKNKKI